ESDDDLLALAHAADAAEAGGAADAGGVVDAAGAAVVAEDHADDDGDEEDTDVRGLIQARPPVDEDRSSQDLTRPVVRLETEPPMTSMRSGGSFPHDGPVMVSGEISIDDMGARTSRGAADPDDAAG